MAEIVDQIPFNIRSDVIECLNAYPGYSVVSIQVIPDEYLGKGRIRDGGVTLVFSWKGSEYKIEIEPETRRIPKGPPTSDDAFDDDEPEFEAELSKSLLRRRPKKSTKRPDPPKNLHWDGSGAPLWEAQEFSFGISNGSTCKSQCYECHEVLFESEMVFGAKSIIKSSEYYCKDCAKALGIIDFDDLTGPQFSFGY